MVATRGCAAVRGRCRCCRCGQSTEWLFLQPSQVAQPGLSLQTSLSTSWRSCHVACLCVLVCCCPMACFTMCASILARYVLGALCTAFSYSSLQLRMLAVACARATVSTVHCTIMTSVHQCRCTTAANACDAMYAHKRLVFKVCTPVFMSWCCGNKWPVAAYANPMCHRLHAQLPLPLARLTSGFIAK